ncbi:hypothetical protein GF374_00005 [Candidatus Woesearchaeota archaeon]|nr:hypothetical protein [Candidatus Woesearchaeota archaeon]
MDKPKELLKLIKKAVEKIPNKSAIAFSGGVDSTLIAALAKEPKLYVVGTENAKDIKASINAAKKLDLQLEIIKVNKKDIWEAIPIIENILRKIPKTPETEKAKLPPMKPNPVSISFNMPLYFVCECAKEDIVVSGQGPDTMLGGFAKFLKLEKENAEKKMRADTKDLVTAGYLQHKAIGKHFGKKILLPYLEKDIVDFCMSLPYELKVKNKKRKWILVKAAELVMDKKIASREKKSAQYGSGVMKHILKYKQR